MALMLEELAVLAPTRDRPWYGHQFANGMVVVMFGMETNRGVLEYCVPDSALVINDGTGWVPLAVAA
jgi:hypothetical protein